MPPNDDLALSPPASPSKLAGAWQQREAALGTQQQQQHVDPTSSSTSSSSALNSSKSTPFQHHRRLRTTSFGMGPTPTRAPSMTLHQRRRTASNAGHGSINKAVSDVRLLPRLEEENANLPPQVKTNPNNDTNDNDHLWDMIRVPLSLLLLKLNDRMLCSMRIQSRCVYSPTNSRPTCRLCRTWLPTTTTLRRISIGSFGQL